MFFRLLLFLHMSYNLRNHDQYSDILSMSVGIEHLKISGCKLPTYEQVLLCFLAHLKNAKENSLQSRPKLLAAKAAVAEALIHYKKARIAVKSQRNLCKDVEKLFEELQEISWHSRRTKKKELFKIKLLKTMPFWPRNCLEKMENDLTKKRTQVEKKTLQEDILFLKSMFTLIVRSFLLRF